MDLQLKKSNVLYFLNADRFSKTIIVFRIKLKESHIDITW